METVQERASRRVRALRHLRRKLWKGTATQADVRVVFNVLTMTGDDAEKAGRQVGGIVAMGLQAERE